MAAGTIAIIIPALNPDDRLVTFAKALRAATAESLVVVNDGSKPECEPFFEALREVSDCTVLRHAVNLGKGRALKDAFNHCLNAFPQLLGAITADADGQHTVEDVLACMEKMREQPQALVMGCRCFEEAGIPARSRFGNKITRQVFRFLCGIRVSDTQTGLRGIPADFMKRLLSVHGERFEFEMNMLVECKQANVPLAEVPIHTIYLDDNASSHFNPLLDSLRIYSVFAKFLLSSLSSFVIDMLAFSILLTLCNWLQPGTEVAISLFGWKTIAFTYITIATFGARAISSIVNYFVNRHQVFKGGAGGWTLVRYYLLCILIATVSAQLVKWLNMAAAGVPVLLWKILVDTVLFLASFNFQREWVFRERRKRK